MSSTSRTDAGSVAADDAPADDAPADDAPAGPALAGEPDAHWAAPVREEMAGLLRRARHTAATAALRTGSPAVAQRVAEAAVAADSYDEGAHRLLMRAHHAAGESARALLVYERLRATLSAELGTDPAPETQAVHLAVLRARPAEPWTISPERRRSGRAAASRG